MVSGAMQPEYHPTVHRLRHCARCGGDHDDLQYKRFVNPIGDEEGVWAWWATCPTTGDPILMRELSEPTEVRRNVGEMLIDARAALRRLLDAVNAYRLAHSAAEAKGAHLLDETGEVYRTYTEMLVVADEVEKA